MPNDVEIPVVPPATEPSGDGIHYDDDADLLMGDEEEEQEGSEEEEEKPEDSDEDEEEEEESTEEEEQKPDIPFDRPTVKEIKAEFPDFFKKFPQLRESYFREIEFTKLFPTVEDAKEAFEDNEAFTNLSDAVLSGDPIPLLESIEKTDKKALELFSLSFLPALYKRDSELYSQTVTPLFQNLVRQFYNTKDENTKNAALVLAEFLFGSDGEEVANGKKSVAKNLQLSDEQKKLRDQKDSQIAAKFQQTFTAVETSIDKSLEALILKDFDPNKVFSPFLRKQGAQEVIKRIKIKLNSDEAHKTVMGARWKKAKANGYGDDDKSKIVATFLARAKSLIPSTREQVRAAMLGTKERAANGKREKTRTFPKENNSGHPSRTNHREKVDYSKMSDMDILND